MSDEVAWLFCRYQLALDGRGLPAQEQLKLFKTIRGQPVAHRKAEAEDDDRDTMLMEPRLSAILGLDVLSWRVGKTITVRERQEYDKEDDRLVTKLDDTDEIQAAHFVAIPMHGVVAVADRSTEPHLNARAAISRMRSVVKLSKNAEIVIEPAGSSEDIEKAVTKWDLTSFSFTVRPFNPRIVEPGRIFHEMMERDGIAKVRGVAQPREGGHMRAADQGLINEATGLANAGYGQVAAEGTTPEGYHAKIGAPKFDDEKKKNLAQQARPRVLKIYIPKRANEREALAEVVRALAGFFSLGKEDRGSKS